MKTSNAFLNLLESIALSGRTWYHGSTAEFEKFSMAYTAGQLGIHFGSTVDQAMWRLADSPGWLFEVKLDIRNPVGLPDTGGWHGYELVNILSRLPTTKEVKWHSSMSDRVIRQKLQSLGYDSVVYRNKFEGESPGPSVIVFNESQITVISKTPVNQ